MYLKNITLINIGAYKGFNHIDLTTEKNKNVILVGGENGSGKTTLLNSIKLGLFGAYGFGYKTENNEYFAHIKSILNNQVKKDSNQDYSITINFSIVDNYKTFEYEIKRSWEYKNFNLVENLYITENNSFLTGEKIELFNNRLREIMPPQLLDLCLFDGEEISRIVNNNLLSNYIEQLVRVVFNLNLFETLELDLDTYSKQQLNTNKITTIEKDLILLQDEEKELRADISAVINEINNTQKLLSSKHDQYTELKNTFEINGGLIKKDREAIIKKISELEIDRRNNQEKIKSFVSTILPFYLTKDLIKKTRQSIINEENLQLALQLDNILKINELEEILKSSNLVINDLSQVEDVKKSIISKLNTTNQDTIIHGASFSEKSKIEEVFKLVSKDELKIYLEVLKTNQNMLKQINELKDKLNKNDTTSEFSNLLNDMNNLNLQINSIQQEIENSNDYLEKRKLDLTNILEQISKINSELKNHKKISSSLLEAQKIILLSKDFRKIQLYKKLQDVEIHATHILKKMMRKNNYISQIRIDPETFNITLYDLNNNILERKTLSAGEKQILLLSIIWGIFKTSGRQLPFIFDTLLGRLDRTHKATVLNTFIPDIGNQVVILSTDSEIDLDNYQLLSPSIAREYHLIFEPNNQQTFINKNYFSFK